MLCFFFVSGAVLNAFPHLHKQKANFLTEVGFDIIYTKLQFGIPISGIVYEVKQLSLDCIFHSELI